MAPQIQYPIALTGDGAVVLVERAESGQTYLCLGCLRPMIPRRDPKRRAHVTHKSAE